MPKPLKQCETRVFRTYRGGKLLDEFLGKEHPADCFQLEKVRGEYSFSPNCFVTLVITDDGMLSTNQYETWTQRGDKFFIPYGCGQITLKGAEAIICFPPA